MPKHSKFEVVARLIRKGDIAQMDRLITNWPPPATAIEVFDAFLPHLSIPESDTEPLAVAEGRPGRAHYALSALLHCLQSSIGSPNDVELSARIMEHLEEIVWWHREFFTLFQNVAAKDNGSTVMTFLLLAYRLTDALRSALFKLPIVVELVTLSIAAGSVTEDLMKEPGYHLPFLGLVSGLICQKELKDLLLDSVADHGSCSLDLFISTILGIASVLKDDREYSGNNLEKIIPAFRGMLSQLSEDSRTHAALRKHKYVSRFLELLRILFNRNPACRNRVVLDVIETFGWITTHQPCRARKSLVLEFITAGGFWFILYGIVEYVETEKSKEVMHCFLGYSSSRRVRRSLKLVMDDMSDRLSPHRKGWPKFGPNTGFRSWYRWSNFAVSFERRLPEEEFPGEFPNPVKAHTFCNNLTHFDVTDVPDRGSSVRTCSGCRTVAYCCESCQQEDWNRVHRFECRILSSCNRELLREGLRLTREVPHNFYFIARHFIPLAEEVKKLMIPHQSDLESGRVVYIDHDVEHPGKMFDIVTVDQYRQAATERSPWSPSRFDSTLEFVRTQNGARLVAFELPCWDQRLRILCVVMEDSNLVPAVAQIEYR